MLKTNEDRLVEFLIQVQPGMPMTFKGWDIDHQGKPFILPSIGGITLNIGVGDSAFNLVGDHVEPGVSACMDQSKRFEHPNSSIQMLANAGDSVRIISGNAKGSTGFVIGHHGGSEHLVIEFPKKVKQKMSYDDKMIITTKGMGLALSDFPEIKCWNLNPNLLHKMKIKVKNGKLQVPVTTIVPAKCMGSGIGSAHTSSGDYDVMTADQKTVEEYKIDQLKFGDFVAILDHDNRYGRGYKQGAISIGIVIHSNCLLAGHGPGITTLLTAGSPIIEPVIDINANIGELLKIGVKYETKNK